MPKLPATSTPRAKEAKVGELMAVMVQDCYTSEDQEIFMKGIMQLDEASERSLVRNF